MGYGSPRRLRLALVMVLACAAAPAARADATIARPSQLPVTAAVDVSTEPAASVEIAAPVPAAVAAEPDAETAAPVAVRVTADPKPLAVVPTDAARDAEAVLVRIAVASPPHRPDHAAANGGAQEAVPQARKTRRHAPQSAAARPGSVRKASGTERATAAFRLASDPVPLRLPKLLPRPAAADEPPTEPAQGALILPIPPQSIVHAGGAPEGANTGGMSVFAVLIGLLFLAFRPIFRRAAGDPSNPDGILCSRPLERPG